MANPQPSIPINGQAITNGQAPTPGQVAAQQFPIPQAYVQQAALMLGMPLPANQYAAVNGNPFTIEQFWSLLASQIEGDDILGIASDVCMNFSVDDVHYLLQAY
jgi:hypothetical protein